MQRGYFQIPACNACLMLVCCFILQGDGHRSVAAAAAYMDDILEGVSVKHNSVSCFQCCSSVFDVHVQWNPRLKTPKI